MMKRVLVVVVLALAGCGGDDPVKDMKRLTDAVCACPDAECRMKTGRELAEAGTKLKAKAADLSADQRKELAALVAQAQGCMQGR